MENFDSLLENLDLELFRQIHSQTSDNDKRSLLACQKAVGEILPDYIYLEIGSYVGGSLQPYILDEKCGKIISIDKRPESAPDERGVDMIYLNNTTEAMLENLKKLSVDGIKKIQTIDGDVSEIDPKIITEKPQICFIDGEHTDEATFKDFRFCIDVMAENGAILFHDAAIIYNALSRIINYLKEKDVKFRAYNLPDNVFVVELGDFPLCKSASISEMLFNNYVGYLNSLNFNDQYRRFANKKLFRFVRNIKVKFTGSNITK
jgi:Methyltransferase domain